ncbi:hypothetical protein ECZU27_12210 [Escherichia coli]|nr:hypothetical protein ECZU27_12210 [Escherichia coli]
MKFDKPAGENPIDQLKVVGRPHDRIDGPLKTTGTARYAYEWHEEAPNAAYGYIVGSAIAKDASPPLIRTPRKAPGVLAVITASNAGALGKGDKNTAGLLGGPTIEHYHQAIALVVAETFEQARAAARWCRHTIAVIKELTPWRTKNRPSISRRKTRPTKTSVTLTGLSPPLR